MHQVVLVHRDLNMLERWADRTLVKLNRGKFVVLHPGRNNQEAGGQPAGTQCCKKGPWASWWKGR